MTDGAQQTRLPQLLRNAKGVFGARRDRHETQASPAVTSHLHEAGETRWSAKRCISSALITGKISSTLENLRRKQRFTPPRQRPVSRPLHLFRFQSNFLIFIDTQQGRGGRSGSVLALHLFRLGVTSLPTPRDNPAARALHLSGEVPFSSIKTVSFLSLLFFPVFPVIDPLAAKLPHGPEVERRASLATNVRRACRANAIVWTLPSQRCSESRHIVR